MVAVVLAIVYVCLHTITWCRIHWQNCGEVIPQQGRPIPLAELDDDNHYEARQPK